MNERIRKALEGLEALARTLAGVLQLHDTGAAAQLEAAVDELDAARAAELEARREFVPIVVVGAWTADDPACVSCGHDRAADAELAPVGELSGIAVRFARGNRPPGIFVPGAHGTIDVDGAPLLCERCLVGASMAYNAELERRGIVEG